MNKTLKIEVFKAPDGTPTCSSIASPACACIFLGSKHFGQKYVCLYPSNFETEIVRGHNGYFQPHKCPLWIEAMQKARGELENS